ncbi:MAG: hypothetical protein LBF90_06660 [Prevotellaceae bacterium]|jgi:cell division protein FtsN|nr:hypothetical protein [Prevotellaceae bacterium]
MESIVPILIAAAVIILQLIASGNKKRADAQRRTASPTRPQPTRPTPYPETPSDPFTELIKSLTSQYSEPEQKTTVDEPSTEWRNAKNKETEQNPEQRLYPKYRSLPMEEQLAVATIQPAATQPAAGTPPPPNAPASDPLSPTNDDPTDDFDIKKAIIYSAILQRKEY